MMIKVDPASDVQTVKNFAQSVFTGSVLLEEHRVTYIIYKLNSLLVESKHCCSKMDLFVCLFVCLFVYWGVCLFVCLFIILKTIL